jgi:hypothetical protein
MGEGCSEKYAKGLAGEIVLVLVVVLVLDCVVRA